MTDMTDLEMNRLCAEAMGWRAEPTNNGYLLKEASGEFLGGIGTWFVKGYDPLHDDAQAMALVKRFNIDTSHCENAHTGNPDGWIVFLAGESAESQDLNRAIVECVAKTRK